jgi:hypothetical protein
MFIFWKEFNQKTHTRLITWREKIEMYNRFVFVSVVRNYFQIQAFDFQLFFAAFLIAIQNGFQSADSHSYAGY